MARFDLSQDAIPTAWFNVLPVMPEPLQPPLHPGTREPIGPADLAPLFPMGLIAQEVSADPWIDVPGEVLDILKLWRPTPLIRAERLERALGTPARIYFKDESVSPTGSHKTNTSVPQAFYNAAEGTKRLATETGREWGSALSFACSQFDLECKVYWCGRRTSRSRTEGCSSRPGVGRSCRHRSTTPTAPVRSASPSATRSPTPRRVTTRTTHSARCSTTCCSTRPSSGSRRRSSCNLAGEEARRRGDRQLRRRIEPRRHRAAVRTRHRGAPGRGGAVVLARADRGLVRLRFGDSAGIDNPVLPMYTLGHDFVPPSIHAGGLRYHGDSPIISSLVKSGRMEAVAYPQGKTFEAAVQFARAEGKIPAPETGHTVRAVIDEALAAKETGGESVILFNFSGYGICLRPLRLRRLPQRPPHRRLTPHSVLAWPPRDIRGRATPKRRGR